MAVSLPSDLIVDVMRNADPARLSTATARLQALSADDRITEGFANLLGRMDDVTVNSGSLQNGSPTHAISSRVAADRSAPDAYLDFERMVLRNLLETLLPGAESGAFGTGPSAGVWRTLAADQLAGLYAGSGGIGIAEVLSGKDEQLDRQAQTEWPYFSTDTIKAFAG